MPKTELEAERLARKDRENLARDIEKIKKVINGIVRAQGVTRQVPFPQVEDYGSHILAKYLDEQRYSTELHIQVDSNIQHFLNWLEKQGYKIVMG